ncbi:MAG: AAA family ATPase [Bacteroidales bacterium]|nr:AAA family ATPase [Bacteroidales bacterium]
MFIKHLNIKNFKGFTEHSFDFNDRFTVIIGNNGSGKTSVLDALAIAAGCYLIPLGDPKKQRVIHKGEVRIKETQKSVFEPQLPCEIEATGVCGEWKRSIEKMTFSNTKKYAKEIIEISEDVFAKVSSGENVDLPLFAYHGTGRLWAELNDTVKYAAQGSRTEGYENCFSVKSSSKTFRNWYKTLEKNIDKKDSEELKQRLETFKKAILNCLDDWDDLYYDFAEDDIVCVKHDTDGTTSIPYRMMSDGYRNMIGMIADIAYRCIKLNPHLGVNALRDTKGLVLIDELDLHLHQSWQKVIVSELVTSFPNIQFVATTHSPFVVQSLGKNQIINLEGQELFAQPYDVSLETNALYMGVESDRSKIFSDKEKAAHEFFSALNEFKGTENERRAIEEKFDEYTRLYSDDPVFVAKLNMAKLSRLHRK